MAAKVRFYRGAWWVITHVYGKRNRHRVGPNAADEGEAGKIAKLINASIALGTYEPNRQSDQGWPFVRYAPSGVIAKDNRSLACIRAEYCVDGSESDSESESESDSVVKPTPHAAPSDDGDDADDDDNGDGLPVIYLSDVDDK